MVGDVPDGVAATSSTAFSGFLRTGAQWAEVPERYPPYQTGHRRFQRGVREGLFERIVGAVAHDLHERGQGDLNECFIDGTFIVAKKGGGCGGKTKRGNGTKLLARATMADRFGLPLAACVIWAASAAPHDVTRVAPTLDSRFVDAMPQRLIRDRAYDADPLDAALVALGIEMMAPHRRGRVRSTTHDGRSLRRYRRRWKIERLFAWLGTSRRLVVRYERHALNYLGFVPLGCIRILLRLGLGDDL